jgi:hypothetical protein
MQRQERDGVALSEPLRTPPTVGARLQHDGRTRQLLDLEAHDATQTVTVLPTSCVCPTRAVPCPPTRGMVVGG